MLNTFRLIIALFFFFSISISAQNNKSKKADWEIEVEYMIDFYTQQENSYGIAIGVIEQGKVHQFFGGKISDENSNAPDSLSYFEIGGLTKAFTAALFLQEYKNNHLESLDLPMTNFLNLNFDNKYLEQITLKHLLTHTAGFPKNPNNLKFVKSDDNQVWENYSEQYLFDYLESYKPKELWKEGEKYEYSNVGYAILGCIAKDTLGAILRGQKQTIQGHTIKGKPTPSWKTPDYLDFSVNTYGNLQSLIGVIQEYLAPKEPSHFMSYQLLPQIKIPKKKAKACYGWHLVKAKKVGWSVYTHSGKTTGHRCFVAFCPKQNSAVIIMANTNTPLVDNIGVQLLDMVLK